MAQKPIRIRRGEKARLDAAESREAELLYVTDTNEIYVKSTDGKKRRVKTDAVNTEKLESERQISVTGAVSGSGKFDGSKDIEINTELKNSGVAEGTYPKVKVNSKGIVVEGKELTADDIPGLDSSKVTTGNFPAERITETTSQRFVSDNEKVSWNNKVDKVTGKQLSTEDYTTAEKNKVKDIAAGAQVNVIETVKKNGTPIAVTGKAVDIAVPTKLSELTKDLTKNDFDLGNADNTSDANKPISIATQNALNNKEDKSNKGRANGYASLDANQKVPLSQINDAILGNVAYQGLWNANTNVPTLPSVPTQKGHYWVVSESGTKFGITFDTGDWIIAGNGVWGKVDNTDAVTSVAGRTGNITLSKLDVDLGDAENTSDLNKPVSLATQAALNNKVSTTGDASNTVNTFSQAATRINLTTGEKASVLFGKIMKWFSDLGTLAFKSSVSKSDLDTTLQNEISNKEPVFAKKTAFNKDFGTTAGTVTQGNDSRLSDARTPTPHNHDANNINSGTMSPARIAQDANNRFTTDSERNKLTGIATGAQVNVIESIKRNGTTLPITSKGVDISVPTKLSDLSNDTGVLTSVPNASTTTKGVATLGASGGAARYGQKADVDLSNVNNTADAVKIVKGLLQTDSRSTNPGPFDAAYPSAGLYADFKSNTADGLNDGGTYHRVLTYRPWSDSSGGVAVQITFTDNGNIWMRSSTSGTAWGAWVMLPKSTGNIATATKLQTGRKINNVIFDGSADITIADSTKEPAFTKNSAFNKNFGTTAGTVTQGNDSRLSDARTPTPHNHDANNINSGTMSPARIAQDANNRFVRDNEKTAWSNKANKLGDNISVESLSVSGYKILEPLKTSNPEMGYINPLYYALRLAGKRLYSDEDFSVGTNNVSLYNNSPNGTVSLTRKTNANAPNNSKYVIEIVHTGTASPGLGGFYQHISARLNGIFFQMFTAKLPVGYSFITASNPQGTGASEYWMTNNVGTGKWENYIRCVICGNAGTFSGGGHVYVSGATPTTAAPLVWQLASCTLIDLTNKNIDADTLSGKKSTDFAPSSHVGGSGTQHALANGTTAGFSTNDYTSADKKKLDEFAASSTEKTFDYLCRIKNNKTDTSFGTNNIVEVIRNITSNLPVAERTTTYTSSTVNTVVTQYYKSDGVTPDFTTTETITLNANNTLSSVIV